MFGIGNICLPNYRNQGNAQPGQVRESGGSRLLKYCQFGARAIIIPALFIIGCLAAAGQLSGIVAGGCIIGFSLPLLLVSLVQGVPLQIRQQAHLHTIASVACMVANTIIGALAIAGIIAPAVAGWVVIAPLCLSLFVDVCLYCCLCSMLGGALVNPTL
jgi:hypothetical protein